MFYFGEAITSRKLFLLLLRYLSAPLLLFYSIGASAIYSINPTSLDFGDVGVGVASTPMSVTFTNNNSTANIEFTSITATGDYSIIHNCPISPALLAETFSCTITATFTPTTTGSRTGTISITGFDRSIVLGASYLPINPTITLSGNGIRGDLILGSNNLDLGSANIGHATTAVPVSLTNSGNAAVAIEAISATGPFAQTNDCPTALAASGSCTIMVNVTPTAIGTITGTLSAIGTGPQGGTTATTPLTATGLEALVTQISITPESLSFPDTQINTSSLSQSITISNQGNTTVSNVSVSISGEFTQTNDCFSTLSPGSSCTVSVIANPLSVGQHSGAVELNGNVDNQPLSSTTALTVNGVTTDLSTSVSELTFTTIPVNSESQPQTVTLTNLGTTTITINSISTEGEFSQTNNCGTEIQAGASCDIQVVFAPLTAGTATGLLSIDTNGSSSSINLSGSAENSAPGLSTSVSELSFSDVSVNSDSQPQILTVTNQGSAPLLFNDISTEGDFTQTNNCGEELAAGSSCDIQVVFSPQSSGTANANLIIDTDQGISRIPLSGSADAPVPSSNPVADLLSPYTGGDPNVISASEVIGEACPSGRISDRMQQDCNDVVGAATGGDENTRSALRQITPESATKANGSSRQGGQAQIRNLGSRIAALRAGARGLSFQGLDLLIDDKHFSIDTIAQAYKGQHGAGASGDNPFMESRLGVFITGDISTGSKDETDLESGLDFDTFGITMGVDYRLSSNFILGGAFGFVDTNTELENDIAEIDTQGFSLNLYGTYYAKQDYFVDFSLGYGVNNFDQSRRIIYQLDGLANVNQDLSADYDGDTFSFFIGSGYDFNRGAWTFGPRADLEYLKSNVDSFTEQASNPTADGGGWATRVDDSDQTWLTLKLGGRLAYTHSADWGVLIPYTRLDWLHEFEDDSQIVSAHFVDDPNGQAIQIETDDPDRDYLRLRLGTSAQFKNGMVGFIDYSTILAQSDWTSNTISIGFRSEF